MSYLLKKGCPEFTDMNAPKPKPYIHNKIYDSVPLNALDWFNLVNSKGEIFKTTIQPLPRIIPTKELVETDETIISEKIEYSKPIQPESFTIPSFTSSKKKKKGVKED